MIHVEKINNQNITIPNLFFHLEENNHLNSNQINRYKAQ